MKKFIVAVDLKNGDSLGFVIPNFKENGFLDIKNGRKYSHGRVVYTGLSVNSEMIIDKIKKYNSINIEDGSIFEERLDIFLKEVKNFKIGDIVEFRKFILCKSDLKFNRAKRLP